MATILSGNEIDTPNIKKEGVDVIQLAQFLEDKNTASTSGAATIPLDNTIPQITEGTEFLSLAITPSVIGSTLEVKIIITLSPSSAAWIIAALFNGSGSDAIVADAVYGSVGTGAYNITLLHTEVTTTLTPRTFSLRAGCNAGTISINGSAGTGYVGEVAVASLQIKEWI